MAVKRKQITDPKQVLLLVSIDDGAIDWKKSYIADTDEMTTEEKKAQHLKDRDFSKLTFIDCENEEDKADVFVFKHPFRQDMSAKLRIILNKGVGGNDNDFIREIWEECYIGKQKGVGDVARESIDKVNGKLPNSFVQWCEDHNVFSELAFGYVIFNKTRNAAEVVEKK